MPRWLITGGAGFIGSNFIRMARRERPAVEIVNFDALTYSGCLENLSELEPDDRYRFERGDVCDEARVEAVFAAVHPEVVIHFAAESHVDRSIADASGFVRTNVLGTQVLLDASRRHSVGRFLHVSTDEVYGNVAPGDRASEQSPLAPNSPYAASKAASDHLVRAAHQTFGLPAIVTRAANNYGPYQFPEKLIPLAIANAAAGEPIPLYGRGENIRNWIHVEDHCRGILAALERGQPGEIYNLGGDPDEAEWDNRRLIERLLRLLGKPASLIQPVADRPGHDLRYALDCSRARQKLGWEARIGLDQGLRQTVEWYRTHTDWLAHRRDGRYRDYYQQQYGGRSDAAS